MKNIPAWLIIFFCLFGCKKGPEDRVIDQCKRAELFAKCMESLPAGPQSVKYNDWDEVVEACERTSNWQALARRKNVKPECAL